MLRQTNGYFDSFNLLCLDKLLLYSFGKIGIHKRKHLSTIQYFGSAFVKNAGTTIRLQNVWAVHGCICSFSLSMYTKKQTYLLYKQFATVFWIMCDNFCMASICAMVFILVHCIRYTITFLRCSLHNTNRMFRVHFHSQYFQAHILLVTFKSLLHINRDLLLLILCVCLLPCFVMLIVCSFYTWKYLAICTYSCVV